MIARRNLLTLSGAGMATQCDAKLTVACSPQGSYMSSPACGILPTVTVHREALGPGRPPRLGLGGLLLLVSTAQEGKLALGWPSPRHGLDEWRYPRSCLR
jgi:hypothetical protein